MTLRNAYQPAAQFARVLGLASIFIQRGQAAYGCAFALLRSALAETLLAILQAPVRMLAHSLFVLLALTGLKLEWKSPPREANGLRWRDAAVQLAPMTAAVGLMGLAITAIEPGTLVWLMPVAVPLLLAVPLTVATSNVTLGARMRAAKMLLIPEETHSPAVLRSAWGHANRLAATG